MEADVVLCLLGPVRASIAGVDVPLGHPRQQTVLAALLAEPGRVVSTASLVDRVWGTRSPAGALNALYGYVSRLRRALTVQVGPDRRSLVSRRPGGYRLDVAADDIDLHRFRHLTAQARTAPADKALALLDAALALWCGEALTGLSGTWVAGLRAALHADRLAALADRNDILLRLGRHTALIGELTAQTAAEPYHERLAGQLMTALFRAGRQADALACFDRTRQRLVAEIGVEPGSELRRLHQRILRDDPTLVRPSEAAVPDLPVPAQLPHGVAEFTGRGDFLASLDALLTGDAAGTRPAAVVISTVHGAGGVGKTATAVHWAHRNAHRFPDGQLYANLRGHDPNHAPMAPTDVLAQFLRALGRRPELIPVGLEEQAALYRSLLSGARMLILLDDAGSAQQVRPLLPGSATCAVLVTHRHAMTELVALDGARQLRLDAMRPAESVRLLGRLLGPARVAAEADAAATIAEACGHLPLALRVVAANLQSRPHDALATAAADLTGEHRLDRLRVHGTQISVRICFALSYRDLPEPVRRLFRLLGVLPGPDFDGDTAGRLLDGPPDQAVDLLDTLAGAHLVERHRPDRYRLHDLLRLYAAELAEAEEPPEERRAAVQRVAHWYLATADGIGRDHGLQTVRLGHLATLPAPGPRRRFTHRTEAIEWLETERTNVVATIRHTAERGPHDVAWALVDALRGFFRLRPHGEEWLGAVRAAQQAAALAGNAAVEAAMHLSLADIQLAVGTDTEAAWHDGRALAISAEIGWSEGAALALGGLGRTHWARGDLTQALDCLRQALDIHREQRAPLGESATLGSLGRAYHDLGQLDTAKEHYDAALAISRRERHLFGEALCLFYLAILHRDRGDHDQARLLAGAAHRLSVRINFWQGKVLGLAALSATHARCGDADQARRHADALLAKLPDTSGDERVEAECLNLAAAACAALGDTATAERLYERALGRCTRTRYRRGEGYARAGLAVTAARRGDLDSSARHAALLRTDPVLRRYPLVLAELPT